MKDDNIQIRAKILEKERSKENIFVPNTTKPSVATGHKQVSLEAQMRSIEVHLQRIKVGHFQKKAKHEALKIRQSDEDIRIFQQTERSPMQSFSSRSPARYQTPNRSMKNI